MPCRVSYAAYYLIPEACNASGIPQQPFTLFRVKNYDASRLSGVSGRPTCAWHVSHARRRPRLEGSAWCVGPKDVPNHKRLRISQCVSLWQPSFHTLGPLAHYQQMYAPLCSLTHPRSTLLPPQTSRFTIEGTREACRSGRRLLQTLLIPTRSCSKLSLLKLIRNLSKTGPRAAFAHSCLLTPSPAPPP